MTPTPIDRPTELREQKDQAYSERNKLVSYLSKQYPSHLSKHGEDATWDQDWLTIVCIHSPEGQLSWHIHDSEVPLFNHLQQSENDWDGHTTDEKYERLAKIDTAARSRTDQKKLLERLGSYVNHWKGFSDMPGFIDEELARLEGEGKA